MTIQPRIKTGDRVRLTIEGKVGAYKSNHSACHEIKTDDGITHYAFLGPDSLLNRYGTTTYGLKAEKLDTPPEAGSAYIDKDGDVFIRTYDDMWVGSSGTRRQDNYPTRPLVKLVKETV